MEHNKHAFADVIAKSYHAQPRTASPCQQILDIPASKPSYASATRGQPCPVLIANYTDGAKPADRVSIATVDQLLGAGSDGPVPQRVRQKDDKLYITLKNPADYERAKSIMEKKPECTSVFKSVTKSNVLYPAVALFVNLSYLPNLKEELMYRNDELKDKVHSYRQIFTKPGTNTGHVKIFFTCRTTRDNLLFRGSVDILNPELRVVEVDLNREVRRCFNCQGYSHAQASCRDTSACCNSKCSGSHRTRDCKSDVKKCASCSGPHHAGDKLCSVQMKAVARYRAALERR